jgi:GAF domain-containing protein
MDAACDFAGTGVPAGKLAEAARAAAARKTPAEALAAVIAMAESTGPCEAASITMRTGKNVESVAYSSDLILKADQLQYELQQGPCLDAVWADRVFIVQDLAADGRWPRWAPAAAGLGVGSSLSVHLFTDTALGSLNLYSLHPRAYTTVEVEAAKIIAAHASVILAHTRAEQNLWQAIDSRNLIGQAQGMIMQKYAISADKAFAVLRRYSQAQNTKLVIMAEQLTTTGHLPDLRAQVTDEYPTSSR